MGVGMRCQRCGDRDTTCLLTLADEGHSDSEAWALCVWCGRLLRAWIEEGKEVDGEGSPGSGEVRLRMFEDHAPREEIEADELMADGRVIGLIPKAPLLTESRTDRRPSLENGHSSSPPVASTLPEEYRWSGLE